MNRFAPRLSRIAARFLGLFLPPQKDATPIPSRSLIAVGTIFLATIFEIGNVTNFLFVPPTPVILWSNVGLLMISLVSLLAIRLGCEPGKVVPFFSSGYTLVLAYVSSRCQCFMAPGMYYFPVFLMFGSLLSRSRWANIQSIAAVVATLFVFSQTSAYGLAIPWGWDVDVFLRRMSIVTIIMCAVSFLTMALQDYYRKQTDKEIRQEREWLFRSSRMFEVATVSGSIYSRLRTPVMDLGFELERLKGVDPSEPNQEASLKHLHDLSCSIENLCKSMRAYQLSPYLNGRSLWTTIPVSRLFEYLKLVLGDRAREEGWELIFESRTPSKSESGQANGDWDINGAVSSLATLVASLVLRNFELYLGDSSTKVTIRPTFAVDPKDNRVSWSISWPRARPKSSLVPDLSESSNSILSSELHERFIQDQLAECGGEMVRESAGDTDQIILRGDWYRL